MAETTSSDETPAGSQLPQTGGSRSRLVQRLLQASGNLPQFLNDLLQTMAVVVAGTEAAGFLIERGQTPGGDGQPPQPTIGLRPIAHIRPDDSDADTRNAAIKAFQEILAPCVTQAKDGAIEVGTPDAGEPQFCLVTLLRSEGNIVAAAAVITRCRDQERARQRLMSMQLVAGYFELYTLRRGAEQARAVAQNHQNVLQLSSAVGTAEGFESAAMNLCNELAGRTGATRVSLGWVKGENIKVRALSNTEKFDKKQELIVQITKVMEECYDQEEPVRYDTDGQRSENVSRAAEVLSRQQGGNSVFSMPLRRKDEVVGVVTLEFAPNQKMSDAIVEALVVAGEVLTPQLIDRYENDRWLATKVGLSVKSGAKVAIGPKHMTAKLVIALVIGAICFVVLFKPMYHVAAPFTLSAIGKQSLSVPFDGFIKKVYVRAGDRVKKGQPLVEMKTDDLLHQLYKAKSDAATAHAQWTGKIADRTKVGEVKVYQAQEQASLAEAAGVQSQIEQATLTAPFDGEILKADLEDKTDASVKKGDVLLEVAQPSVLRAELYVSEKDIQELWEPRTDGSRQHGLLSTSSYPSEEFGFTIDRIVPLGNPKEGDNVFTVFVTLDSKATWMRPGMAGEARVDVGKRRLGWIWTHRLVDFLKLKLWM